MPTFIPTKTVLADDRGGNHFVHHFLQYDATISTVIDTAEGLVDAAVLYGSDPAPTKPTVTVSQSGSTVTLSGGTSGAIVVVTRHVGNSSL